MAENYNIYSTEKSLSAEKRNERRNEILETVQDVCKKFGGQADIGEGFVVVDTKKFEVRER